MLVNLYLWFCSFSFVCLFDDSVFVMFAFQIVIFDWFVNGNNSPNLPDSSLLSGLPFGVFFFLLALSFWRYSFFVVRFFCGSPV